MATCTTTHGWPKRIKHLTEKDESRRQAAKLAVAHGKIPKPPPQLEINDDEDDDNEDEEGSGENRHIPEKMLLI